MKLKALGLTALAVAAAALVAACGGGGGDGAAAAQSDVQLSGVAATGLALASAPVEVKCASGTGTVTTDAAGTYTVTVANGALPCIVKVTGTAADGTTVTLHSLAQGTGSTAVANVTPLTEMILARAVGTLPADLFANFGTGTAVTAEAVAHASTDILTALGTAANVDLSGIDPFKTSLVAATTANPTCGNDYDKLLDQLGTVVSAATLPQVVSQIASTTGSGAPTTLNEVVANVSKGTLAGCAQALSGKYRIVDYVGASDVVDIDFKAGLVNGSIPISPSSQACEFDVMGTVPTTVVIGPAGAGVTRDTERAGFIFPVQSHNLASVTGKWEFLESGVEEASFNNTARHWIGEMTIAADGKIGVCDYNVMQNDFSAGCLPDTDEAATIAAQADGTFKLQYGDAATSVYGFRAPSGELTLFGTNNPTGSLEPEVLKTNFVLTRAQAPKPAAVGSISKYWDVVQSVTVNSSGATVLDSDGQIIFSASAPARNQTVVTATTETSVTRKLTSSGSDNGRVDTLTFDSPIQGMRSRPQGVDTSTGTSIPYSAVFIRALPGAGISVALDNRTNAHFMSYTVARP